MYKSLEALRIISAMLVVTAHISPTTLPLVTWFFGGRVFLGSIGVDVFFIISGLVMGMAFQKRTGIFEFRERIQGFFLSRASKIFPLYMIATLLAVFIAPIFGRTFPQMDRLLLDLILMPELVDGRFIDPIIGAGWTLRYELFFYFVVFCGLLTNWRHLVTLVIIAVVFVPIKAIGYYSTPLLLEFLGGYLLASRLEILAYVNHLLLRWIGLLVAIILFLLAATGTDFPPGRTDLAEIPRMLIYFGDIAIPRVIAWGIPAFLLVISMLSLEHYVPHRFAILGKYTYSLYLMQYFCLPLESKLLNRGWSEEWALIIMLLVLAAITFLSYTFIEKPLSVSGRRKISGSSSNPAKDTISFNKSI